MKQAAHDGFVAASLDLEDRLNFMYLDTADPPGPYVTTGIGNKIDPMGDALPLPWQIGHYAATRAEVIDEWQRVKAMVDRAPRGGGTFKEVTTLRLTDAAVDALVLGTLAGVDRQLAALFPAWNTWPADANLALCLWAWAVGAHAAYPRMIAALRRGDFLGAAAESTINPQRGTIIKRNQRIQILLTNAACVVADGLDPDTLYWPHQLTPGSPICA